MQVRLLWWFEHLAGEVHQVSQLLFLSGISIIHFLFQSNSAKDKHYLAVKVLTVNLTAGVLYDKYWELSSAK